MGIPVEVLQIANLERNNSPSLLERKDRQPAVTLTADALGRPSGTVADDVVAYIKKNPLPNGIQNDLGAVILKDKMIVLGLWVLFCDFLLLIYLIMVALYDSYIYPFVALFAIPVAAIGAF